MASTPAQAQSQGGGDATEGVVERMRAAEIEARAQAVSRNVRCLECGHQSIEESGANIAVLLRKVIRDELRKGKAEAEIYKTLSEEYGESILYAPKFDWQTAGLYLVPVACLGGAAALAWYRQRRPLANTTALAESLFAGIPLTPKEREALHKLIEPSTSKKGGW